MLTMLAPGCNIDAAGLEMSGTSQATPFVAAAIAVLRSRYPTYTPAEVVSALTSTGVQVGPPGYPPPCSIFPIDSSYPAVSAITTTHKNYGYVATTTQAMASVARCMS